MNYKPEGLLIVVPYIWLPPASYDVFLKLDLCDKNNLQIN